MTKNVNETPTNTNTEESARELLALLKADIISAAGLVTVGAEGMLDRDALVKKLADAFGLAESIDAALAADGAR